MFTDNYGEVQTTWTWGDPKVTATELIARVMQRLPLDDDMRPCCTHLTIATVKDRTVVTQEQLDRLCDSIAEKRQQEIAEQAEANTKAKRLRNLQADAAAAGYKLVPIEPTQTNEQA